MARYMNPTAGPVARSIMTVVRVDPFGYFIAGGAASIGGVVAASIIPSMFAFLLLIVPILYLVGFIVWNTSTKMIREYGSRKDSALDEVNRLYPSIRDTDLDVYARPVVQKIWDHALTHESAGACFSCNKRAAALRELVPAHKDAEDFSDVKDIKQFVAMRKELGE